METEDSQYDYISNQPCSECHRRPLDILCTTCSNLNLLPHVRHPQVPECTECNGKSLVPTGAPHWDRWICACCMWEKGQGKAAEEDLEGLRDRDVGQVQMDEMIAVKLDSEQSEK